ncbi:NADP-dependent oxidoreductase domain protein [Desulfotomaculum nigrificans CO-1-SRB]|uniref:NADP-dependent oxidoreductase domain protein n=1 Tax=Desulfotomaculum nigrificans (strain DSM 14880 / VKM B-2319 / CO-1-SRB) TaxID=868595 RepID=F6B2V8_DESCC|nr:aldo/keto reductase [Desulfotomaculum nigrificans]AEF95066.1 NADP-dependent oxidoreductase domain protein [Desulfotomaculum nigrificans CO-1-SRB]
MDYRVLGETGIKVSRLCFGALTIGPLQANLPLHQGATVIRRALEQGVNFIDTAELYQTYPYIREAIRGRENEVVICSKCYAYTREGMQESLEAARRGIDRDYIDIFMLHEQESDLTIKGHWEAIEYLLEAKTRGLVRAVGISTHHVAAVLAAAEIPELEVIHPIINIAGVGIADGSTEDMLSAIKKARQAGKGIYGMKALGGGNLLPRAQEALEFVLGIPELAAVAVGMQNFAEVDYNIRFFGQSEIPEELKQKVARQARRLHIDDWCQGCGACVAKCGAGALYLEGGQVKVKPELCRLCGYCGAACPLFAIKVI